MGTALFVRRAAASTLQPARSRLATDLGGAAVRVGAGTTVTRDGVTRARAQALTTGSAIRNRCCQASSGTSATASKIAACGGTAAVGIAPWGEAAEGSGASAGALGDALAALGTAHAVAKARHRTTTVRARSDHAHARPVAAAAERDALRRVDTVGGGGDRAATRRRAADTETPSARACLTVHEVGAVADAHMRMAPIVTDAAIRTPAVSVAGGQAEAVDDRAPAAIVAIFRAIGVGTDNRRTGAGARGRHRVDRARVRSGARQGPKSGRPRRVVAGEPRHERAGATQASCPAMACDALAWSQGVSSPSSALVVKTVYSPRTARTVWRLVGCRPGHSNVTS